MRRVLPVIVLSQFFCTSLWFAGNAVMPAVISEFHTGPAFLGHLTSAVQFGFIAGTFVFALFTLSDRFLPSRVFFISAIAAGACNLGVTIPGISLSWLIVFRVLTGFFLAGIYPVGMKIASDHYREGLGRSLGFLVGALVIGTALPHLLRSITASLPWKYVLYATSLLSVAGGTIMWRWVPAGRFQKRVQQLKLTAFLSGFRNRSFRSSAFGYFGHMWELYAFWAFVPAMLGYYQTRHPEQVLDISLLSFFIIGSGSLACIAGGMLSQVASAKRIATVSLFLSGCCCLLSPFFLSGDSAAALIGFLFFWGWVVIADSPLFSTLVARNAPEDTRGTSLTIVNCIGFAVTIISIQLVNLLLPTDAGPYVYMLLAAGPACGVSALLLHRS